MRPGEGLYLANGWVMRISYLILWETHVFCVEGEGTRTRVTFLPEVEVVLVWRGGDGMGCSLLQCVDVEEVNKAGGGM